MIRSNRFALILPAALLALGACARAPADQDQALAPMASAPGDSAGTCADADWYRLGVAEGASGRVSAPQIARIRACPYLPSKAAAEDDYLAGHAMGVAEYCAPQNALRMGRQRIVPTLTCPEPLTLDFNAAYAQGLSEPAQAPDPQSRDLQQQTAYDDGYAQGGPFDGGGGVRVVPSMSIGIGSGGWSGMGLGLGVTL